MTARPSPFEVRVLLPGDAEAWLNFFDHEAFADNPRWASCYCQFPTTAHATIVWKDQTAEGNRERACQRIAAGQQRGVVAFAQGRVVGWCHAGPWTEATIMDDSQPEPLAERLGAITCFVVAPTWRGVGVAKALLDAACEALRLAGCVAVDAWTQLDAPNLAAMHTGPLALYERAGFAKLREVDGRWVMRKPLTP
ncbi:MAG: GNAT family N-acetyltransferase [Burkholderiales bacterium]|nr:GNAT family N-acetyltransferase [Burkholderiales bacterium]